MDCLRRLADEIAQLKEHCGQTPTWDLMCQISAKVAETKAILKTMRIGQ